MVVSLLFAALECVVFGCWCVVFTSSAVLAVGSSLLSVASGVWCFHRLRPSLCVVFVVWDSNCAVSLLSALLLTGVFVFLIHVLWLSSLSVSLAAWPSV